MRKSLFFFGIVLILSACDQSATYKIIRSNNSQIDLKDVPVVLNRAELEENLGDLKAQVLILDDKQPLQLQMEDLDGDGSWDEVFALIDMNAGVTKHLTVRTTEEVSFEDVIIRTNIRMARRTEQQDQFELTEFADRLQGTDTRVTSKYFQYEGPGWENDKIAFRNYFDERNGMDIFGKTTKEMILHKIGVGASYHELQDWGMDILKVGNSLGSGAIALLYQDSLYRVTAPEGASYQLVKSGSIRSIFDLDFEKVQLSDQAVGVKHRIIIEAGVYGFKSQVYLFGESAGVQIVTGIVNMESEEAFFTESGNMNILYTYDKQSFDKEYLGMAVMASDAYYKSWSQTPDEGDGIIQTYYMVCQPGVDNSATFHFLAGWELSDDRFKTREGFEEYLKEEAMRQIVGSQ
jgi:hypothetical protein